MPSSSPSPIPPAYVLKSEDYYRNFKQSIKSKDTFVTYDYKLKDYMKYKRIPQGEHSQLVIQQGDRAEGYRYKDIRQIEADIVDFVIFLKERHYSLSSQKTYLNALIHFYNINDITPNRKKISKFLSNDDNAGAMNYNNKDECDSGGEEEDDDCEAGDKPYTPEQIAKLLEFADLRTKVMILLMCSSGMRIGVLPPLKVGDLIEIPKYNIYQIRVYAFSRSNKHFTFWSAECKNVIDNYLNYRKQCGENIIPKSPLLRREYDKHDIFQVANDIKPITRSSVRKSIHELLYASGLRTPVPILIDATAGNSIETKLKLNSRRPTAMCHGFRKFFDTTCTHSGMNQTYIEFCLGHKLPGVKGSYFLPQPDSNGVYLDILEGRDKSPGYLDAIDALTINAENRLRRENQMLKVDKSEIEQLKEEAEKYKSFMSRFNPQIEEFQREINSLKLHINSEMSSKKQKKRK
jgi:integrase